MNDSKGGILIATSSIFTNVIIHSDESANAFIKAFEDFQKNPDQTSIDIREISDPSNIENILSKLVFYNEKTTAL